MCSSIKRTWSPIWRTHKNQGQVPPAEAPTTHQQRSPKRPVDGSRAPEVGWPCTSPTYYIDASLASQSISNPVASIWIAMVKNLVSFFFDSYKGRSIRLKQVCAFGNTETASGIELIVNFRILLSLPWRAQKPWAGTPEVPVTNWRSLALCSSSNSSTTTYGESYTNKQRGIGKRTSQNHLTTLFDAPLRS